MAVRIACTPAVSRQLVKLKGNRGGSCGLCKRRIVISSDARDYARTRRREGVDVEYVCFLCARQTIGTEDGYAASGPAGRKVEAALGLEAEPVR